MVQARPWPVVGDSGRTIYRAGGCKPFNQVQANHLDPRSPDEFQRYPGGASGYVQKSLWLGRRHGVYHGPPPAPELARQAFIASRTNAWLSLPMLLFMGTSHGDWLIFGGH